MKKNRNPRPTQDFSSGSIPGADRQKSRRKKREVRIDIYRAWCKACGICVAFCPAHVLTKGEDGYPRVAHPEACTGCEWCEIHCPDFAITVREKKSRKKRE